MSDGKPTPPRREPNRTGQRRTKNRGGKPPFQKRKTPGPNVTPAVLVRRSAARVVSTVASEGRTFDDALGASLASELAHLEARDVAFARLIAVTTLRRLGQIDDVLVQFLAKPLDKRAPFARAVLQTAVAQLLFLDVPAHAVIDVSVRTIKAHKKSQHFSGLTNAVLRKIAAGGAAIVTEQNAARLNTPTWMLTRWEKTYGAALALNIAEAHASEPSLDLTLKDVAADVPDGLEGLRLATGSLRLANAGRIESLPGYETGDWWVQDAAAALPARLLGDVAGKRVLDLCAAPGGKTAQLCAADAIVTALDSSASRMKRVASNLARLNLTATTVVADALTWVSEDPFDAVLLDAPCSATGTIRRHPDIPLLKHESDIAELAGQQLAMLHAAADRVCDGGLLVFCTCSLESEEGPDLLQRFLLERDDMVLVPIDVDECGIPKPWLTTKGTLRTLPCHSAPLATGGTDLTCVGIDGFFAARLRRNL